MSRKKANSYEFWGGAHTHWHTVRRSRLFTALPTAAISLLVVNFAWEVVRNNGTQEMVRQWPLRFSLIDVNTTANALAIFGGLILARAQFARTVRPSFGYSWIRGGDIGGDGSNYDYNIFFYNGGPGHARIKSIEYRVKFHDDQSGTVPRWVRHEEMYDILSAHGIARDDLSLMWLGRAPLVPQQRSTDGFRIAGFTNRALAMTEHLDIWIFAEDAVGDEHELRLRSTDRLPRMAIEGATAARVALSGSTS